MAQHLVSITHKQERAFRQKVKLAGGGSIESEILKAIAQYPACPKEIETAFMNLLAEKAPKDLPAMLARLKKTNRQLDRSLAQLKAWRMPLEAIDHTEVVQLALQTFGSPKEANDWFNRCHRALGRRTPLSLMTSQAGVMRVKTILVRIAHGVHS